MPIFACRAKCVAKLKRTNFSSIIFCVRPQHHSHMCVPYLSNKSCSVRDREERLHTGKVVWVFCLCFVFDQFQL